MSQRPVVQPSQERLGFSRPGQMADENDLLNGKHRDFNVGADGKLIVVEEEVDLAGIPAAAKATIEKKAAGGKLGMVEAVDKGDGVKLYEASYTTKGGKKGAIVVKADGAEVKD